MLDSFVMPWAWDGLGAQLALDHRSSCAARLGSAVMCWYLKQSDTTLEEKSNAGIVMMLMNAAGIAAFNAWAVPPVTGDIHAHLVDLCPDPDLRDDRAHHAATDARRVAGRGVVRSARLLDRVAARRTGARAGLRVHHLLADLRVRVRRRGAGARPAAHRPASARGAGSRELSPRRAARAPAAWARSGAPSIVCWRATRRSSWCGPKCSAPATRTKRG